MSSQKPKSFEKAVLGSEGPTLESDSEFFELGILRLSCKVNVLFCLEAAA